MTMHQHPATHSLDLTIRPLHEHDLPEAQRVFRLAFGTFLPGPAAAEYFDQLLRACESLTVAQGLSRLVAGVNLGRQEAYQRLLASGFRADMVGVAMEKPNEPGYNHVGIYLIDDWR